MPRSSAGSSYASPDPVLNSRLCRLIGTRIHDARSARGISIIQLSAACEIATDRLRMIEGGEIRPEADEFWDISQFLEKPIGFFFSGYGQS